MASSSSSSSSSSGTEVESSLICTERIWGVNVGNPRSNEATPTDDGAGYLVSQVKENVTELMKSGSKAFQDGKFDKAIDFFDDVAVILVKNDAKSAAEYVQAKIGHGLALLAPAPIRVEDDLMTEALPMEADYLLHSIGDGSTTLVAKQAEAVPMEADYLPHDEGIKNKASAEELQCAKELKLADSVLREAWRMVQRQPADTMQQVDIVSALGEAALKKGNLNCAYERYRDARSILKRLVEEDNPRIAHLNFKMCLCMANSDKMEEAIEYCKMAIAGCEDRIQRLTDEVATLEVLLIEFVKKVPILRMKSTTHSTSDSSSNSSHE